MITLSEKVNALLEEQVAAGQHVGVQVSAYRYGAKILDTCAGTMGKGDSRRVKPDTLFLSFSTTKGVAALAVHILADRGKLRYSDKVSKHWRAFGHNGKEEVTIEQALSHQAGLHVWPEEVPFDKPERWDDMIHLIEEAKPAYPPGTAAAYQALTYGYIVGGLVEAVDGRHVRDFVAEEVAEPLGVQGEMMFGLPQGYEDRAAVIDYDEYARAYDAVPVDSVMEKALPRRLWGCVNTPHYRRACNPSANGFFSARALAKMYGALANGGEIDGVRLVSKERIGEMSRVVTDRVDLLMGAQRAKGVGFLPGGVGADAAYGSRVTCFGHSGAGGSFAYADPVVGLSVAVTLNRMVFLNAGEQGRADHICALIRKELGAE